MKHMGGAHEFRFLLSCDINQKVKIRICNLEGKRKKESLPATIDKWIDDPFLRYSALYTGQYSDVYVMCVLVADGKPLCLPEQTSHHTVTKQTKWDETLVFSATYQDLPVNTQCVLTVWDVYSPRKAVPVGGTSFYLFGKNRILRKGRQKLTLFPDREADANSPTTTPGKAKKVEEVDKLDKLMKKYERGLLPHVEWLDGLTKAQIKKMNTKKPDSDNSDALFLYVDCHEFELPVVFREPQYSGFQSAQVPPKNTMVLVFDAETSKENPAELKYLKLTKSHRMKTLLDRELKPNNVELKQITQILKYTPTKHLSLDEKEILWKFRYYLSNNKKALTKFFKCVDWSDTQETKQAVDLMKKWEPIELDDALELLGATFPDEEVRSYAVSRIEKADDEELLCYLLQLVQALKYEKYLDTPLVNFVISRASANFQLGNFLYWYLTVESNLKSSKFTKFYKKILTNFTSELQKTPTGNKYMETLRRQDWLVTRLTSLCAELRASMLNREKRIEKLRQMLAPKGDYEDLVNFAPLALPLNPNMEVVGIVGESANIFKSAKAPLGLKFKTVGGGTYGVIFKSGDDLRQDQLVIQLITLMDRLLKKENMDLKLTPYKVLATAEEDGMVELIPSEALASVIKQHDGDIRKFLRNQHPDPSGPFEMSTEVLDNFVKSNAGYCVITYILGIGDRHLDNLLLTTTGNLFHIDFGFILGADPKPLPPPMKLCKEMVEGMGGQNSKYYSTNFKQYCCESFNILRKSSNLIMNLFSLMADANILAISAEPEKSVLKVQDKFRLELTDEEAAQTLLLLLNESVSALFPVMVEYVHKWAQYWRS